MILAEGVEKVVMVEGPAVGKAGNCLDWIARGLEINSTKFSLGSCYLFLGSSPGASFVLFFF